MADALSHQVAESRAEGRKLLITGLLLVLLAGLSWGLAHVALAGAEAPVALGIAAVKACIVALMFMELTRANIIFRFIALLTVGFIVLLCAGVLSDVALR